MTRQLNKIRKFISENKYAKIAVGIVVILIALLFFGDYGKSKGKLNIDVTDYKYDKELGRMVYGSEITSDSENEVSNQSSSGTDEEGKNSADESKNYGEINAENSGGNNKVIGEIICDISGAVISPGVYTIAEGARLNDLIELAGGLTEDADIDRINRARTIIDGEKVYIPNVNDESASGYITDIPSGASTSTSASTSTNPESNTTGKININTANSEELQRINGIGPATADKIINYRTSNGSFDRIEDLKNVSGIGEKTFAKMKDDITV